MWQRVVQRSQSFIKRNLAYQKRIQSFRLPLTRSFSSNATNNNHSNATSVTKRALAYAPGIATFHWLTAGSILGCFGFVELAKRKPKGDPEKLRLMNLHKSFGLIAFGLISGRIARRFIFVDRVLHIPGPLPGVPKLLHYGADASHVLLYSMMVFMPVTGVLMGYFGGKGLPFFGYRIPGTDNPNKQIAGNSYKYHKKVGKAMEILVGLHVSASIFHHFAGHKVFPRIMNFSSNKTNGSTGAGMSAILFKSIKDGYSNENINGINSMNGIDSVDKNATKNSSNTANTNGKQCENNENKA